MNNKSADRKGNITITMFIFMLNSSSATTESVYKGKEFNSHGISSVHQHILRFTVSVEVKMTCSCYPIAKVIQNRVWKQNNCPSFRNKRHVVLHTDGTSMVSVDLHGQYKTSDCGLRTADCGLRTADCGLRTADCGLRTADCGLLTTHMV